MPDRTEGVWEVPSDRSIRILIGFSRRSASDDLVRLLLPELEGRLGRRLAVELMPGELGAKAARAAIASRPDGNTLLMATFGTHAINPNLKRDLGYDPLTDFEPVCLATRSPLVLGTRPSLGARNVEELVEMTKRAELTFGSSSVGSAPYLAGMLFQRMARTRLAHRAYGDTRELYRDLEAGRLDLSLNNASTMLPLIRKGRVRALAVTTPTRSAALPTTPTLAESGLPGYALNNWLGFVAPPGTNAGIAAAQAQAISAALRSPSVAKALACDGIEAVGGTPREFADHICAELDRWSWLRPSRDDAAAAP